MAGIQETDLTREAMIERLGTMAYDTFLRDQQSSAQGYATATRYRLEVLPETEIKREYQAEIGDQ